MTAGRILLTALVLIVGGCTVTVVEDRPPVRPTPRPEICPRIYQPVCAERFGERDTLPNACVAETRGYDVLYRGECRRRPVIIEPPISPRPPRPSPLGPGVVCPEIYAPVCAAQGGLLRTFPNACIAQGSGFRVVEDGPCLSRPGL